MEKDIVEAKEDSGTKRMLARIGRLQRAAVAATVFASIQAARVRSILLF
jgi:hypothetical protein